MDEQNPDNDNDLKDFDRVLKRMLSGKPLSKDRISEIVQKNKAYREKFVRKMDGTAPPADTTD